MLVSVTLSLKVMAAEALRDSVGVTESVNVFDSALVNVELFDAVCEKDGGLAVSVRV